MARFNRREHIGLYVLASLSNLFISIPEYLGVRSALLAFLPVRGMIMSLISSYGTSLGLVFDLLWTSAIFEGILAILVIALAACSILDRGWRVLYIFSGMFLSGFNGYWLGARFLRALDWISLLQNHGVAPTDVYSSLFWFGLGATVCFVGMILVLRRGYDNLLLAKK